MISRRWQKRRTAWAMTISPAASTSAFQPIRRRCEARATTDPLAFFGYLSAVTSRIRFATYVLVLAYSHPLEIAKRYGTLDLLSRGRLVLGMGVGSLKAEFDLLGLGGAEFDERGVRGDDALRALRASLGRHLPEYRGPYYNSEE